MNKIEEITRLKSLFDGGAINQEEFSALKMQILSNKEESIVTEKSAEFTPSLTIEPKRNESKEKRGKRIFLNAFQDSNNNLVSPPDITHLYVNKMSDDEIEALKPFIRLKQINAPEEFTADEIEIGNKLFSSLEIDIINSERKGMNYKGELFGGIFCAVASGFFLYLLPCLIIFGAGLAWIVSLINAISVLRKNDATKLDRSFAYVNLGLVVLVLIIYFTRFGAMFG